MPRSRRGFFGSLTPGGGPINGAFVASRGREALVEEAWEGAESVVIPPPADGEIRLTSNENPRGPGDRALNAVREAFNEAGRYPTNAQPNMADLKRSLAEINGCEVEHVVLAAGSGELLKNAVHALTSPERHLVTATPTYKQPERVAAYLETEIKRIPLDSRGRLDLDAMADAARGAGLIFVCNPNNPTGTVHGASDIRAFVDKVRRISPDTVIHFDEAYHEYVANPDYETAAGLSLETPNVFVTRTFSKVYGMAGLRVGYGIGHKDLMEKLGSYALTFNTNTVGVAAAHTTLQDKTRLKREVSLNSEARSYTIEFFRRAGHEVFESNTNFIFVHLGFPAAVFRDRCALRNVGVGRDFPPMEKTHARISIGTLDEMRRATKVFAEVLA